MNIRAGLRDVRLRGQSEQQVGEGITREDALIEGEGAEIIRAAEAFNVLVGHPAHIHSELKGVAAFDPREVVGELDGLGFRGAVLVPPYRRIIARIVAEIENRKRSRRGVVAQVQTLKP